MKKNISNILLSGAVLLLYPSLSCTKLDAEISSQIVNENFWNTPEEVAAGKAPAYAAFQRGVSEGGAIYHQQELTTDEMIIPTRGSDWGDGGLWARIWYHEQKADDSKLNDAWNNIYNGVGTSNFIIHTLNNLDPAPATATSDLAEVTAARSWFYYQGMDLFGNIPYVRNFKQDPLTVVNIPRKQVFDSLETDIKAALPHLTTTVDLSTYGKITQYYAYSLLAKMYLNAEIYTGTPRWNECIAMCDQIINSGKYSLMANYFDNFKDKVQEASTENIFVVPFDGARIKGHNFVQKSIQASSGQYTFNICCGYGDNGWSTTKQLYDFYDTTSTYEYRTESGHTNKYRTFHDMRSGQFLFGQQFVNGVKYPPYKDVMVSSTNTTPAGYTDSPADAVMLYDQQSNLPVNYFDTMYLFSNANAYFRMAGLRNIKYFPDPQTNIDGNMGNDFVVFRYADILLMKAECQLRLGVNLDDALENVNMVRRRAYGYPVSSASPQDWTPADLTLDNIYAERARELAWEMVRRQDMIRFGTYLNARTFPDKPADNPDKHTYLFPIPSPQYATNPNLVQNPGYSF